MASLVPPDRFADDVASSGIIDTPLAESRIEPSIDEAVGDDGADSIDNGDERLLPFSFAKRHGVLVKGFEAGKAVTLVREDATPVGVAEVRRFTSRPLQMQVVNSEEFDAQLQQIYERESNSTMQMVDGLGDDNDLLRAAQDLPEPSDLLESDDDAPIIRLSTPC